MQELHLPSPYDELARLRAEIARLQAREVVLAARLAPRAAPRAGWPIRRQEQPVH